MKLGFVSAILPALSLDEVLSFASREGFSVVDVMRIGYDGPVCIEVEDDTFCASLEGRMKPGVWPATCSRPSLAEGRRRSVKIAAGTMSGLEDAEVESPGDHLSPVRRVELFHEGADVSLHRPLRDPERSADLGVAEALA